MFLRFIIIVVLLISLNPETNGQQQTDSLMLYLELAAKNNPLVLQRYAEYQAALEKVPQVGSLPDPELNTGVFLRPMELLNGKQLAEIQLMQMFPWFGTLNAAKDEMSLMAKSRYETFRDAKSLVFLEVQRTWYEMQKNFHSIRITGQNIEILKALERLALVRFRTSSTPGASSVSSSEMPVSNPSENSTGSRGMQGMGNTSSAGSEPSVSMQDNSMDRPSGGSGLTDLYRIQIEIGDLENNVALLRSLQITITARFNSYLGRNAAFPVILPDTMIADTSGLDLLSVPDNILKSNPMLMMLEYERQSFIAREKMVRKMGFPMVGLGISYSVINKNEMSSSDMNGKDMVMPMVSVTLPVYRKKYKAMHREAVFMKSATEQNFNATANSLQTEYYQALQLYEDARRRIKLYADQSLLSKKSLDIVINSFSVSGSGLADIFQIRRQNLDYEFKKIEATADINTAIAWLKRLGNL